MPSNNKKVGTILESFNFGSCNGVAMQIFVAFSSVVIDNKNIANTHVNFLFTSVFNHHSNIMK
jgi:hypothetical protein